MYGIFGREVTKYMVEYGEYISLWPTIRVSCLNDEVLLLVLVVWE